MRKGIVYLSDERVGLIHEDDAGIHFVYDADYLTRMDARAISFTLPLRPQPYTSKSMIPFFDGLIPEGWLLQITEQTWKINPRDRMALLLTVCRDTIGAVTVVGIDETDFGE